MKTLKLLAPLLLITLAVKAQLPATEFLEHFVLPVKADKAPAGYGFSAAQPILVGAYEDMTNQDKVARAFTRFSNTYWWPDGSPVRYISRKTVMIDAVNYELFRTVKPGTTDTLTLYADLYKSGPVSIPEGFKTYTKEQLAAQFAPAMEQLKAYNAIADKYADTAAQHRSLMLVANLSSTVGIDFLIDQDYIGKLVDNYGIDPDVKTYLIRSYVFHKFECEVTGQDNPKDKAFNAMVDDYMDLTKRHQGLTLGNLAEFMVKKS